jgi:hypothetical protein
MHFPYTYACLDMLLVANIVVDADTLHLYQHYF